MNYLLNRAWAEVDLDNIAYNIRQIRKYTNRKAEIIAIVKADAYGHGVMGTVKELLDNGVTMLAVSMLDEAIQLREYGIKVPILILNYTDPKRADEIILNNLTQTVFSHDLAEALSNSAINLNKNVKIHIKIDTGMTRVGFMPGYNAVKNVEKISRLKNIIVEGLFTHFSVADEKDSEYTMMQFDKFISICHELNRIGINIPIRHVANSAAIIQYPHMHLEAVRPGVILYGLFPSDEVNNKKLNLKPAMSLKANIILVKEVDENVDISYGRIFTTKRKSRIATIPIGYADGYSRLLTGKGEVLIKGKRASIVGRICMDQCMIDITHIEEDVKIGDEVVLFGTQEGNSIYVEELAEKIGTINYEVVSVVGKRIPRVYIKNKEVKEVLNYLI
ncbi:MAG: alanine racemase [Clostridiales bacterium]